MTPEHAAEIARQLYEDHPAARDLLVEAVHGATEERRRRSAQALRWLDPTEDLGDLPVPGADAALKALRWCLLGERLEDRVAAAAEVPALLEELTSR